MKIMTIIGLLFAANTATALELPIDAAPVYGVKVVEVSQYENLMPGIVDSNETSRLVTLLDLEVEYCKTIRPEDFYVQVEVVNNQQVVTVYDRQPIDCMAVGRRQKLHLSTSSLTHGQIVIANPVLITHLPAVH